MKFKLDIGTVIHTLNQEINARGETIPSIFINKRGVIDRINMNSSRKLPFRVDFGERGFLWCCIEDFDYVIVGNRRLKLWR